MNREQRRSAKAVQARRQARERIAMLRPRRFPMIVKADTVLRPLEDIIEQIERHDTMDVSRSGMPIFRIPGERGWYATAPAIRGVVEAFDLWAKRHGQPTITQPLHALVTCMECAMPIQRSNLDAVRALLPKLRAISARFGHEEAADIIRVTQIREAMERAPA